MKKQTCSICGKKVSYWGDAEIICLECADKESGIKGLGENINKSTEELYDKKVNYGIRKDNDNSGCYIATVCYEDENSIEVLSLKMYRDQVLLRNWFGKILVNIYYKISPRISKYMENKRKLNKAIKTLILNRIVKYINKEL